jgi:hypothetical protein
MIDISQLTQDVMDGKTSPYKALHYLKQLKKDLEIQIEIIEVEAFNQCEYEDKTFEADGFKIEKRNGRKIWNFKKCQSYQIAKDNLTEIKDDLKSNYQQFERGKQVVDQEGEVGEIPEVTYTKDSLIIKKS